MAEVYETFRRHAAPSFPLDVCLMCCVSEEVERALREWPLEQITARHLYEYNGSAKGIVQPVQEVKHLLPRMLDLLSEGEEIHHSIELSLIRLGLCPEGSWNDAERRVLDRFALAYFALILHGERRWHEEPLSVLLMFHIGGFAVQPLLDLWLQSEDPVSTVQFVTGTYWDFWEDRKYRNAFASDRHAFQAQLQAWMLDPVHRQRFASKMLTPAFQALADVQPPIGHMPFLMMAEGVFDQLTQ
ncbi:hypothetical protein DZC73_02990 [Albitalea terrae]|uniref:Uncharacterized protein n=1 Tax=Piscinibacter terrae TaxID=2496871 RepID=A0A3N7J5D8_9BURK|nr:hypothetical protein DZC73_02990 [Albitalea terrae]